MSSAPPLTPLTTGDALPLDGRLVHLPPSPPAGLATATDVVRDHLTRLGARFGPGGPASAAPYAPTGPEAVIGLSGPHPGQSAELALRGWPVGDPTPFDETAAQAACGLMAIHGRATGGPRPLGLDYLGTVAGVAATQALLATALAGLRGVPVHRAHVSVAEAAVFSLGQYAAAATAEEEPEHVPTPPYRRTARPPFVSADGVRFEVEALDVGPWRDFWKEIGVPAKDIATSWRHFVGRYARAAAPLITTLAQCAARHRYATLCLVAERTGMSICSLRTLADRRADHDVRYDDDPWELRELAQDPLTGDRLPYTGGGDGFVPRALPGAPRLPLAGIRVVESTRRIQGPLATRLLQALGAHIIRIEPPGGDPLRGVPPIAGDMSARFAVLNAGKEVREIDIRTAAGRRAVAETVADADVFLHNWAPGKAAQLRLDDEDLARVNPRLVYAWASAWDRVPGGARPLGTDFMVQAWSGVADRVRTPEDTPAPSLVTLLDVLGGHIAAEGILAALLARESGATAGRLRVDSSLLGASRVLLRPLLRGVGRGPAGPPATAASGFVALTSDGLIAVGGTGRSAEHALTTGVSTGATGATGATGRRPATAPQSGDPAPDLSSAPSATWLKRFHEAGVPAREVVTDIASLPQDPAFSTLFTHQGCALPTPPWRFS
ncbi:CoA transferase [Streptomyces sp. BPSDS2]|uniref:CoA transferase n=1 Tax=Streptomyces sp. BPSDS2 TaxID=2571021 RepID=UPI0010C170B2|nr:CoA transferase [Streptomyces sp. BPSDS2]